MCYWLNDKRTSEIVDMTLKDVIPEYLSYKESKQRESTVDRDRCSLNQLCDFIGYTKPIAELNYLHIEGSNGLINHLQNKGYSNNGINITLRHLLHQFIYSILGITRVSKMLNHTMNNITNSKIVFSLNGLQMFGVIRGGTK